MTTLARRFWYPHGVLGAAALVLLSACQGIGLREVKSAVEQAAGDSSGVQAFYAERDFAPYWTQRPGLSEEAYALIDRLCRADDEGLDARAFDLPGLADTYQTAYDETLPDSIRRNALARLELDLAGALVRFSEQLSLGVVDPGDLGVEWRIRPDSLDARGALARATGEDLDALLDALTTSRPAYAALRAAHARYRQIAASGGWPEVGRSVGPQSSADALARLNRRLRITNDLPEDADTTAFTTATREAISRFQTRHGLEQTGTVDAPTRRALNVPAHERSRQLALNLERARWMPADLDGRYLLANLAAGRLRGFDDADVLLDVPATSPNAALLADTLRSLTMAPTWSLAPADAARLLRAGALDEASGFEAFQSQQPVALGEVTADELERGTVRIRQQGGLNSRLGSLALRARPGGAALVYDASGGEALAPGLGVGESAEVAAFALDWTSERAAAALRSAQAEATARVLELDPPLPFYAAYLTAWADPDGTAHFRPDRLNRDPALRRALVQAGSGESAAAEQACQRFAPPADSAQVARVMRTESTRLAVASSTKKR